MSQVTQSYIDEQQGEGSGNDVRLIINALIDAALTKNSGPTPPPDPRPLMEWHNTSSNILYERDADNSGWFVKKSFEQAVLPTLAENELNGYIAGSEWYTTDARIFKHSGNGIWIEIGESQAAALFAPTIGVLGGRRFADSSDATINTVVLGGPRFALGASAPTPVPSSFVYGLIPSVRFPIDVIYSAGGATDPQFIAQDAFSCIQLQASTVGYGVFDFPIMTAPTFLVLKLSYWLASGSAGTIPWQASTAKVTAAGSLAYGTASEDTASVTTAGAKQVTSLLLHSVGAVIGDTLSVRFRRNAGTAGPINIHSIWIEQNP